MNCFKLFVSRCGVAFYNGRRGMILCGEVQKLDESTPLSSFTFALVGIDQMEYALGDYALEGVWSVVVTCKACFGCKAAHC